MLVTRAPWYIAGPLLGFVIVALRALTNKPLGALGGYIDLVGCARDRRSIGFGGSILIGTVIGGFVYARLIGVPSAADGHVVEWTVATLEQLAVLVIAGTMIGLGARIAGGCTSGHGMSGVSLGSRASLMATMTFFATAVLVTNAVVWLTGGGR